MPLPVMLSISFNALADGGVALDPAEFAALRHYHEGPQHAWKLPLILVEDPHAVDEILQEARLGPWEVKLMFRGWNIHKMIPTETFERWLHKYGRRVEKELSDEMENES